MPAFMLERPEIPERVYLFWVAWCELSTCRAPDGVYIPWTAVDRYAERHALSNGEFHLLIQVIRALDDELAEIHEERRKCQTARSST